MSAIFFHVSDEDSGQDADFEPPDDISDPAMEDSTTGETSASSSGTSAATSVRGACGTSVTRRGHGARRRIGRGRGRGRGGGRGRGTGQGPRLRQAGAQEHQEHYKSYDDPDVGNVIPQFTPNRPPGVDIDQVLLRNSMTTALSFFQLFFTAQMVANIVSHTNSYAWEHISDGTHKAYASSDGSWAETTSDEINQLIALLIYFGLVKVTSLTDKYWSTKTIYHGLWARSIMPRLRFRALMAFLHVVDPGTEDKGNKLRKVDSFLADFKAKCLSLYQPYQNLAVDERMVKSRHRSGIRQYIKDKPTKWGIKLWVLTAVVATQLILMYTLERLLVEK